MNSNKQVVVGSNPSHTDQLNKASFCLGKRHKCGEETSPGQGACCGIARGPLEVPDEGGLALGMGESLWCAVCVHGVCIQMDACIVGKARKRLPADELQPASPFCQEIFECLHMSQRPHVTSVRVVNARWKG